MIDYELYCKLRHLKDQEGLSAHQIAEEGGGPRCLDSLMRGISSESVFDFFDIFKKHQAAFAKG